MGGFEVSNRSKSYCLAEFAAANDKEIQKILILLANSVSIVFSGTCCQFI